MLAESTHLFQDTMPDCPDWVVVIGGTDARIYFRRDGVVLFYKNIFTADTIDEEVKPEPRTFVGPDGRRYRTVNSSAGDKRRRDKFVRELCAYLEPRAGQVFAQVALIAAAETIATLKACIGAQLQKHVFTLVERDVAKLSPRQLEQDVASLFPVS